MPSAVTAVIVPNDVQELDYTTPDRTSTARPLAVGYGAWRRAPRRLGAARRRGAQRREQGGDAVGQGALGAPTEVIAVAELLGAGVAKALLGKDVLPDDLPFVTGSIGLLGTKAELDLMQAATRC